MLCALAREAIRERLELPLPWTVRVENSLGTGGKDLHAADLMAVDGRICHVLLPLIGQIADPDHSPPYGRSGNSRCMSASSRSWLLYTKQLPICMWPAVWTSSPCGNSICCV